MRFRVTATNAQTATRTPAGVSCCPTVRCTPCPSRLLIWQVGITARPGPGLGDKVPLLASLGSNLTVSCMEESGTTITSLRTASTGYARSPWWNSALLPLVEDYSETHFMSLTENVF